MITLNKLPSILFCLIAGLLIWWFYKAILCCLYNPLKTVSSHPIKTSSSSPDIQVANDSAVNGNINVFTRPNGTSSNSENVSAE